MRSCGSPQTAWPDFGAEQLAASDRCVHATRDRRFGALPAMTVVGPNFSSAERGAVRSVFDQRPTTVRAGSPSLTASSVPMYTRSMRLPSRHRISHGIVPIAAAISRTSMPLPRPACRAARPRRRDTPRCRSCRSSACPWLTAPTIGARRPRTRTKPRPAMRRSMPSAYPAGMTAMRVGRSAVNRAAVARRVSPARMCFTATTRLRSDSTGLSGSVDASGGGTTP